MGFEAIPRSLAERPQWLLWRFEENEAGKKPRKMPYYVSHGRRTGEQGSETDRGRLATLDQALMVLSKRKLDGRPFDGIGFAFLPGDGLIGVDIDGAIDTSTGEVSELARDVISRCGSYTEYSPSRKGVHIIVAGTTKTFKSDKIGLEVFCGSQFFTFTGERYSGTADEVAQIAAETLESLRARVDQAKRGDVHAPVRPTPPTHAPLPEDPDRAELESALNAISPDIGYEDWLHVGMALCNVYGPVAGFDAWDRWSAGGQKYAGRQSLEPHWKSFSSGVTTVTARKIFALANATGWRWKKRRLQVVGGAEGKGVDTPSRRSASEDGGKAEPKKRKFSAAFWGEVDNLKKRFTLVYGTDTAYDHEVNRIIKISALRLAFGKHQIDFWLQSPERRMVLSDNVVFDPSGKSKLPDYVNLFYGMPLKPDSSKPCGKILELLHVLCNEEDAAFEWVLKWLAYPMQHPGAKMETAIIMHGEEGAGKNLFWAVAREIYGPYSTVITQNELESQFNTWASRKLFMIANEVVSRGELREHKGRLKNYITEDVVQINEKMLPLREERNCVNFVFLSNETVPMVLDRTDRRYLVIWTPPKPRPPEFYAAVGAELRAGGAQGLYAQLLEMDLGDFDTHAKPIMTRAKENLLEVSKPAPELFFDQWASGMLNVPYVSALARDLYRSFTKWCSLNGEKHAPSETKFGSAMQRLGLARQRKWLQLPGSAAERYVTVYVVAVPEDSEHYGERLEKQVSRFAEYLTSWDRGEAL